MNRIIEAIDHRKGWVLVCSSWLLINLVQAAITPLLDDEAYYWLWGTRLNWGYFDHPPFVALLTKIGALFGQTELGVRLLTPLLSMGSMILLLKTARILTPELRTSSIALPFLSAPVLSVYAFITTPDVPLLFFGSAFLYGYLKLVKDHTLGNALILAMIMACLMYSKYHAALIILISIAAYPKILLKRNFWFSALLALLLYAPHFWWQYENGFPSFSYHLVSRAKGFKPNQSLEFLVSQLVIYGPLLLVTIFFNVKAKLKNPLTRILLINAIAFPVFFLVSTLNGRAEAHWSALGVLSAVILAGINFSALSRSRQRLFVRTSLVLIGLLVVSRIVLVAAAPYLLRDFKNDRTWARIIQKSSENRPVVFINSYRRASKYQFYSGQMAYSENNYYFRKNQFDLWKYDTLLFEKPICMVAERHYSGFDEIDLSHEELFHFGLFDSYIPIQRLRADSVKILKSSPTHHMLEFELTNPYPDIQVNNRELPISFYLSLRTKQDEFIVERLHLRNEPDSFHTGSQPLTGAVRYKPEWNGALAQIMVRHGDLPQIAISPKFELVR